MDKRPVAAATFLSAVFGMCKMVSPVCKVTEEASGFARTGLRVEQVATEASLLRPGVEQTSALFQIARERDMVAAVMAARAAPTTEGEVVDVERLLFRRLERPEIPARASGEPGVFERGAGGAARERPPELAGHEPLPGRPTAEAPAEPVAAPSGRAAPRPADEPHFGDRPHVFVVEHARDPDQLACEAIDDIAHHRPDAVVAKLKQLAGEGKVLDPVLQARLLNAVARQSQSVARRLETALNDGIPLNDAKTRVIAERGRMLLVRDIQGVPRTLPSAPGLENQAVVYVDTRLRIAREGLLHDPGHQIAFWAQQPGIKLEELEADIGELPDRLVEGPRGLAADRASGALPAPGRGAPIPVYLIRQCDADLDHTTRRDAC